MGEPGDFFGIATAVSGDVIMIGAWGDDDMGTDAGAVYVYRLDGALWTFEQKLTGQGVSYRNFGGAIAIDGEVAVVGAAANEFSNPFDPSGRIYLYEYDGQSWTLTASTFASDSSPGGHFGHSVDLVGTLLLVGAPRNDNVNGDDAGAAYLLEFDGESWTEERWIAPDGRNQFGFAVSLDEDHAVVTAPVGAFGGSAHAYRFNGAGWDSREFYATTTPDALFGHSVSLDGDIVLVGARDEGGPGDPGAAFAFAGAAGSDCDCDLLTDGCAILFALSSDANADFIPDDCQPCAGDLTGPGGVADGNVDALDFLALIAQWGTPCADPCTADITGPLAEPDGNVDALDFLMLIAQWGSPSNC